MSVPLRLAGLRAGYGAVEVLHGVSLTVPEGRMVAIVGPNGAGKTTLMGAVMGLLPRRGGSVDYQGEPAGSTEAMVTAGAVLVPEKRALFSDMNVEDNLLLGHYPRRRSGERDARPVMQEVFAIFPRLAERRRQLAGTLSGGERQMLALGRALMARPRLLLLDEPSLGLAPLMVREIFRLRLRAGNGRGRGRRRQRRPRARPAHPGDLSWPETPRCQLATASSSRTGKPESATTRASSCAPGCGCSPA
jgi:branched-chain amino acid transport system ATP-binding protein